VGAVFQVGYFGVDVGGCFRGNVGFEGFCGYVDDDLVAVGG
jgi:hypothetical protein